MTILGAILAGGKSPRFGSDKALAKLHGKMLIDHARTALSAQCDEVVVIGRANGIPDVPEAGLDRWAAKHGLCVMLNVIGPFAAG